MGDLDGVPVAVSGSDDRTVRVWDLRSGSSLRTLRGHTGWERAVAMGDLDGVPVAVSGGGEIWSAGGLGVANDRMRVWDLRTGGSLLVIPLDSPANVLSIATDGGTVALGSADGLLTLRLRGLMTPAQRRQEPRLN